MENILTEYIMQIIAAIVAGIAAWLGLVFKKLYQKHINTQTKKDVVYTVVQAVEQIYKDLHGEEKLNKALEAASEMLKVQGITVTDLELKMLIESAVGEFNGVFAGEAETAPAVIAGMTAE